MAAVWYALIFLVAIALMLWAVRKLDAPGAKERLEIINTLVTTAAIFVGAVWVWDEFSRERKSASRLTIYQDVSSFPIPDDQILLHIQTTFTNAGQTRVSIDKGFTRVQRILPLDP